jgi:hypothetical protein
MAGLATSTAVGQEHNTIFSNMVLGLLSPVSITTINLRNYVKPPESRVPYLSN